MPWVDPLVLRDLTWQVESLHTLVTDVVVKVQAYAAEHPDAGTLARDVLRLTNEQMEHQLAEMTLALVEDVTGTGGHSAHL